MDRRSEVPDDVYLHLDSLTWLGFCWSVCVAWFRVGVCYKDYGGGGICIVAPGIMVSDQNSQGDRIDQDERVRSTFATQMIVAATHRSKQGGGLAAETGDLDSSQSGERGIIRRIR